MRLGRIVAVGAGGVVAVAAGVLAGFVLGLRRKDPRARAVVRRVNRTVFNPWQMRTAGMPGAYAAIVRHVGRTSGRRYETPVGAEPTDEGFVIALPYGPDTDWARNVLAAGSAEIVHEGRTHRVDGPRVTELATTIDAFDEADRRALRAFGVDQALTLRRVPDDAAPVA